MSDVKNMSIYKRKMNNDENEMIAARVMKYVIMQLSLKIGLNIFG